jgi:hypothetical protein
MNKGLLTTNQRHYLRRRFALVVCQPSMSTCVSKQHIILSYPTSRPNQTPYFRIIAQQKPLTGVHDESVI